MSVLESASIYGIQIRESANNGSDFSNAAADYRIMFLGEDGFFHLKDSAGTVTSPGGSISSGTSFPGGPATNDLFYRTDLALLFFYDGTRWLSTQVLTNRLTQVRTLPTPYSATTTGAIEAPTPYLQGGSDIWLVAARCAFHLAGGTAPSGSHKWVGTLTKLTSALGETTIATFTIDSGSASVYRELDVSIGALLRNGTAYFVHWMNWTKTGTPGNLTAQVEYTYRIVAT